ncbi:pentatricopeptide repeat-containing protein At1g80270, mitochondrial-like [Rutidosis leptorrhynchoides]|uniref:pentatricopeptide repeat-containing protein At1g80270, mitochondrial-like n=1 Tax=Rutidosis leptorrhynchoides TaxID=125765 RepID=UPI003A998563
MLAIRKASARIKCLPVSSVTFRACSAKFNLESSSYTDDARLSDPTPHKSDRSRIVKINLVRTRIPFIGTMSFSSQAGTEHIGEDNDDLKDDTKLISNADTFESESEADLSESEDVLDLSDPEEEIGGNNGEGQRGSSGLFKVIINSTSITAEKSLDKWLEEGRDLCRSEISHAMFELRRRRMYGKALQFLEWLESKEKIEFGERDYASRIDLIAKIRGIHKAESYINKIPESFRGEIVYRTLLANAVLNTNTKKAVQIFNRMKDLKLPVTTFACNQLLLLYKRIDKKKIADVLLLMENENVKPSVFTYRLLIETKGQYNDLDGMEQVLETMKSDGMEPDLRLQAVLARQYIYGGVLEKAKSVLKEMEGSNLNVNRKACSYLLSIYALLGSLDDVKRVWGACESDPRLEECTRAIEAFGKLKEVDLAEAVFDKMSKKWEKLSAKNYACMLRVYANNKMLAKGKDLVRRMSDSGCRIGPLTWDALVKLYLESGEIEKADSILNKASQNINVKPLFVTYMMILDDYAKRGDVHNAEKIFNRMRKHGYISRFRQYNSLLLAYINAKVPAYGFRERLKADNVFPSKTLVGQLEQVDAFKKTAVSDLLD